MKLKLWVSWHCKGKVYCCQLFYFPNYCLTFAISSQKQNMDIGHSSVCGFSLNLLGQYVRDLLSSVRNHLFKLLHYQLPDGLIQLTSAAALLVETVEFHKDLLCHVKLIYYISFKLYYADDLPKSTFVNKYTPSRDSYETIIRAGKKPRNYMKMCLCSPVVQLRFGAVAKWDLAWLLLPSSRNTFLSLDGADTAGSWPVK